MKDLFFSEIAKVSDVIVNNRSEEGDTLLLKGVAQMIELSNTARKEGLLALEDEVGGFGPTIAEGMDGYLQQLIMLVVDGTDPEVVERIALTRYFSSGLKGYEAMLYLIYMDGTLLLQKGVNPRVVEEEISSMLPGDLYKLRRDELHEKKAKYEEGKKKITHNKELLDNFFSERAPYSPEDRGYYMMSLFDYVITTTDDKAIQRLLREIEVNTLEIAMKHMSGPARKKFYVNLSQNLADMVVDDLEFVGPVRLVDALDATDKIFQAYLKLVSSGEITVYGGDAVLALNEVFRLDIKQDARRTEEQRALDKMHELLREYELHAKNKKFG